MRPPSAVSSAPAGGSREQEQGEAQGGTWGARAPRIWGRSPHFNKSARSSWGRSPHFNICPQFAGRDAPQTACRETRQPREEGPAFWGRSPHFDTFWGRSPQLFGVGPRNLTFVSGAGEAIGSLLEVITARPSRSPCRDAPAFGGGIRSGGQQPGAGARRGPRREGRACGRRQAAGGGEEQAGHLPGNPNAPAWSRHPSREWRMGSGEWDDEERLASSLLAVRCSLFAVRCLRSNRIAG